MSFSIQKAICYLINEFNNWLRQRFDDNKNEKMVLIVYKCLWFDKRDNEKRQSLDKYENDGNDDRYVPLLPIVLLFQKKKNQIAHQI